MQADNRALRLREARLDTSVNEKERLMEQQRIKYRKQADDMVTREKRYFEKIEQQEQLIRSQKSAVPRQAKGRPVCRAPVCRPTVSCQFACRPAHVCSCPCPLFLSPTGFDPH